VADLSPAAQAIFDVAWGDTGIILGDHEGTLRAQLAAALRAATDQVVPEVDTIDEEEWIGQSAWQQAEQRVRFRFLAIATELDPTP
jgi:hypothetical protein